MRAIERRERILDILCEKRFVTVQYLTYELKTARSTLQEDILDLSLTYPIFTKKGKGGGVYIADGFYRDKRYLNESQEQTLVELMDVASIEQRMMLESILKKFARPKATQGWK